jgi:hypothetical protein
MARIDGSTSESLSGAANLRRQLNIMLHKHVMDQWRQVTYCYTHQTEASLGFWSHVGLIGSRTEKNQHIQRATQTASAALVVLP